MRSQQGTERIQYVTQAEFAFDTFPRGPCASKAHTVLCSLEGIFQVLFDPRVRRAALFFDPEKVDIPLIHSTVAPFGPDPRVVSVTIPIKKE